MNEMDKINKKYQQAIIDGCCACKRHDLELVNRYEKIRILTGNSLVSLAICQNCGHEKMLSTTRD